MTFWIYRNWLVLVLFLLSQSGCGPVGTIPSSVPEEAPRIRSELSPGDTRQKVHSVLGSPLIDAEEISLEVYRISGRDIEIFPFFPAPGPDHVVIAMVLYDDGDLVEEYSVNYGGTNDSNIFMYPKISASVGDFVFENMSYREPETLYSPIESWERLIKSDPKVANRCVVIFIMGNCPMEKILLDEQEIIDFGAGVSCQYLSGRINQAILVNYVESGSHELIFMHEIPFGVFRESFSCDAEEVVFAKMIKTRTIQDWWHGRRIEGRIEISKSSASSVAQTGKFRRILWHGEEWFAPNLSD